MNWNSIETCEKKNLGPRWWEQGFFPHGTRQSELYHRDFEELRLRDISLFALGDVRDKKILDIGCGAGLYSLTFLMMGAAEVCGQDISPQAIEQACAKMITLGYSNFVGKAGDCANLQFEDDSFDLIYSGDVFEHITDELKLKFIREAYRVLKPGGVFTVKTPNKNYLRLSNALHRIKALLSLKNPFNIHIAHTRNNPDNEHHGLTTHRGLESLFSQTMFHFPTTTLADLNKGLPRSISRLLGRYRFFNQHIIMTVRKPVFFGFYK